MKTKKSKYYTGVFVKAKFELYSSEPSYWSNPTGTFVEKESKVTFYMPY